MKEEILEKSVIAEIVRHLPRRPAIDEPAEVELIDHDPKGSCFLAVAADSVSEEVATGLYSDPFTIGWVVVMAAASDLAAVGARPLGVSTVLNLPPRLGRQERSDLARGIGDACRSLGMVTLGGDTGTSGALTASAFVVGLVPKGRVVTRIGALTGDALYLSGPAGVGNAYALTRFAPQQGEEPLEFRPRARFGMGRVVSEFASCVMDTSDGLVATLDELSRVNHAGFTITAEPRSFLHPRAWEACRRRGLPHWLALAGCHGEFELAFTVRPDAEGPFLTAARTGGLVPLRIGQVTDGQGVFFAWAGPPKEIDSAWIRNLRVGENCDVQTYIERLVGYARRFEA